MHLRETLSRWLRKAGNDSSRCPACDTSLSPAHSFCPHCYMVLRPEGMAELHQALQGAKVREDIYILRRLHRGNEDEVKVESLPPPPPVERVLTSPPAEETRPPTHKPESRRRNEKTQNLMTYAFPTPPSAGPDDLPSLIRWFLNYDPLLPNNLEVLEEAHRLHHGPQDSWTYERHLTSAIADDLRTYDSPDLLQEHLILLTTVYARTLHALRRLGSQQRNFRSPADLPEPERQEMWELCLRIGLTATRLRVEGWVYQLQYGAAPSVKKVASRHRAGAGGGAPGAHGRHE